MTDFDPGPSSSPARIAVLGAGAVGCYYGGMLARAGHEVVLIGRPSHVTAMQTDGLRLEAQAFDERVAVQASTDASAVAGASVVLFCVKSTDTEEAARELRAHLAPNALVLSLQNGVDNADRLRGVLAQTVAAAVVYVATEMAGPGHVRHHGRGELVIEDVDGSQALAALLRGAGVPTEISDNARGALWAKLILNSAYNALSAISRMPYGVLIRHEGVRGVIADVVGECVAVAEADGVRLPADLNAAVRRIPETMPAQYSSTAQDLRRGKRTEIDHLNGFIARRGVELGVSTPVNRLLHTLVRLLESGKAGEVGELGELGEASEDAINPS